MGHDDRLSFSPTARVWLQKNFSSFNAYLYKCVDDYSREYVRHQLWENPFLGKAVIDDFVTNSNDIEYNLHRTLKYITSEGHEIGILSGSRGAGKTSTGVALLCKAKDYADIQPAFIGPPNAELERHGFKWCASIGDMAKDDYAIYDEAALFLKARRSQSATNVNVLDYIPTLRHTGIRGVLFLTQSTKKSDIALLDWTNFHVIKSYSDAYGVGVERAQVDTALLDYLSPRANYVIPSHEKSWSFVRTGMFKCLMYCNEVPWYSDKVGKSFNKIENEEQGIKYAIEMLKHGFDAAYIENNMKVRGLVKDIKFWKKLRKQILDEDEDKGEDLDYYRSVAGLSARKDKKSEGSALESLDNEEVVDYYNEILRGKHEDPKQ